MNLVLFTLNSSWGLEKELLFHSWFKKKIKAVSSFKTEKTKQVWQGLDFQFWSFPHCL